MKKLLQTFFLVSILVGIPLVAVTTINENEASGKDLCVFADDVFNALRDVQGKNKIKDYEKSSDPIIQSLAEKFVQSFQKDASPEELQLAISELGRLIKCSADETYRMPYKLNKVALAEQTRQMAIRLKDSLPESPNYHKLMIESLADGKYDLALYAYLKIAEERISN